MESIQQSLKKMLDNNQDFKARYEKMQQAILQDQDVKAFLDAHPEIDENVINRRLSVLHEYRQQSINCDKCQSVETCCNVVKGYSPNLKWENDDIHIVYDRCRLKRQDEERKEKQKMIKSLYMPQEILEATVDKIDYDPSRKQAFVEMNTFLDEAKDRLPHRGLFFTGPFGVGKTFFLGVIANRLSELNYTSTLIYMPEFVREMREAINTNTVQETMNVFKYADVLMIDDIGAETMNPWFRDEVLGSILQYRMNERLPVFFTSNYSMDQLEKVLATSTKGGVEEVKAGRIMERIRKLSIEIPLGGDNRRNPS